MFELRNVTVRFGRTTALDTVSLSGRAGEGLIVRGPSGCGKTTLLRVIAGLQAPDRGEVRLHGALASCPGHVTPPHQRGVAFVFQEPRLWPHMTVSENVTFGLEAMPRADRAERLAWVAETTGIRDWLARYPAELSGGQARRVAVARALAPRRPLVLMDEPFTNLDDPARRALADAVRRAWEEERFALVCVTHDARAELDFASRVVRLDGGRLASDSAPPSDGSSVQGTERGR